MKLWEAILEGSKKYPQYFGGLFRYSSDGKVVASCAIGAALSVGYTSEETKAFWGIKCPVKPCTDDHMVSTIAHLNDDHKWSRENIAYWVRTIEEPGYKAKQIKTLEEANA